MNARTPDPSGGSDVPSRKTGSKVMLVLLAIVGGLVLLCCGGGLYLYSRFEVKTFDSPADIAAVRGKVMQIEIPPPYEPITGAEIDLIISRMRLAMYRRDGGVSQIAILEMNVGYGKSDMSEARKQMREQGALPTDLDDATTESRTYEIDGEEVAVVFSHGKLKEDSKVFRQPADKEGRPQPGAIPKEYAGKEWYAVQAVIPRTDGMVIFMATGPEEEFDDAEIDAMLKSIRLNRTPDDE